MAKASCRCADPPGGLWCFSTLQQDCGLKANYRCSEKGHLLKPEKFSSYWNPAVTLVCHSHALGVGKEVTLRKSLFELLMCYYLKEGKKH